jgi:hypothetical protein
MNRAAQAEPPRSELAPRLLDKAALLGGPDVTAEEVQARADDVQFRDARDAVNEHFKTASVR